MTEPHVVSDSTPSDARWRCTVCGYVHAGPEPPEKCPVCGADRSKFELISSPPEERVAPPEIPAHHPPESDAEASIRWKCSVCGYIHLGAEPPDKCPVCGADRSKFVRLDETPPAKTESSAPSEPELSGSFQASRSDETAGTRIYRLVTEKMVDLHAHPISVHIPNGVAPVAVVFLLLSWIFSSPSLEIAAFANMVVVLLAMPFVIFSGYNDWQRRFGGHLTPVFWGKIICGGTFTLLSLVIVSWRIASPHVMTSAGSARAFYILLHLALLGIGATAGYLGGKLVFHNAR